jgi:hypothetical protein
MGVVVFVVVEDNLEVCAKKNLFSCVHTQKKISSSRQQQGVRSRLAYLENASFSLFLIY